MTYSIDFRKRFITFATEGYARAEVGRLFGITPTTLNKWEKILENQGNLVDKTRQCLPRKLPKEELLSYLYRKNGRAKRGEKIFGKISG